jgi:hypothetical protein
MLVIVASNADAIAQRLLARWHLQNAKLLTSYDLSSPGWVHSPNNTNRSCAVISGNRVDSREIVGVLNRLPIVLEDELSHIAEEDRAYVAAEMNAFLLSWMTSLSCPLLNRPTPNCLLGPSWRTEEWVLTAARLGIPVCSVTRRSSGKDNFDMPIYTDTEVTVIGDCCFGTADSVLIAASRSLAGAAGVSMLSVCFREIEGANRFLGASLQVDLSRVEIADAVLDYFTGARPC